MAAVGWVSPIMEVTAVRWVSPIMEVAVVGCVSPGAWGPLRKKTQAFWVSPQDEWVGEPVWTVS